MTVVSVSSAWMQEGFRQDLPGHRVKQGTNVEFESESNQGVEVVEVLLVVSKERSCVA